jgi:nucleoside-diphosphate-sugar epimerase
MTSPTASLPYRFQDEFGASFSDVRVLVTGATGFVGTNLCQSLRQLGAQVVGLGLPDSLTPDADLDSFLPADLTSEAAARHAVETVQPEIVFHLAGQVDTRQSPEAVIPTLTHNLLAAVHLMNSLVGSRCRRVVMVTSSESPPAGHAPNSPYAASKLAVAAYAGMYSESFGLPVVIARPHLVFGPHQAPDKLVPYLISCGLQNVPPRLSSGRRLCDPVYVKDVARALLHLALADGAPGQTVDIGGGTAITVAETAAHVLSLTGSAQSLVFGAFPDRAGERPQVADLTAIRALTSWSPRWSFDQAVRETIDWVAARRATPPAASEASE